MFKRFEMLGIFKMFKMFVFKMFRICNMFMFKYVR